MTSDTSVVHENLSKINTNISLLDLSVDMRSLSCLVSGIDAIGELASYDTRLRVELVDWTGTQYWAEYSHFSLGSPQGDYQLYASGYSGTAGTY
ncbi:hypothetical protein C0Q70_21783 [Pomacea canaliculata]|uniref:Fibrinogen C-terminal domain-containing protein n=1 Tax=Pomacea canaliculata TaxID=400727 RepID=A0A2T7NAN8_POMCA|nr:hypothetical protein C0Q70_21783 [Pomacea canaliculata]